MPKEYILKDVKTHYEPIKCTHCGKNIKHVAYIRQVDSNVIEHVGLTCLKKLLGVNIVFINNNYYEKALSDNKKIRKKHSDIRYYVEHKHKCNKIYQTPLNSETIQIYDDTRKHVVANLKAIIHAEFLIHIRDRVPFIPAYVRDN